MQTHHDLIYASHPTGDLGLDLYLPESSGGPWPVVMWVPGGGWMNCNKSNTHSWLAEEGFAVASINYRVSSVATAPANLIDCATAVRWLREHAEQYNLDHNRVGAWGSSAGGHLVALLGAVASDASLDGVQQSRVQAVCDFCGPTDLTRMSRPEVCAAYPTLYDVTAAYLGGPVGDRLELARRVSPLCHVTPAHPPTLIVHGTDDAVVPIVESEEYHQALLAEGVDATFIAVPGAPHGIPLEPVRDKVLAFFDRTLKAESNTAVPH